VTKILLITHCSEISRQQLVHFDLREDCRLQPLINIIFKYSAFQNYIDFIKSIMINYNYPKDVA